MSPIDHNRVRVFAGALVALVALFEVVLWITGADPNSSRLVYMFTPMIAGLVVAYRFDHSLGEFGVRVGNVRWLAGAVVVGLLVVWLTIAVSVAVPGIHLDLANLETMSVPPGLLGVVVLVGATVLFALTTGLVTAFGEEFGWRGYLLWELAPLGFWRASLAVGAVWGLWHVPGIVGGLQYDSFPFVGIVVFTAATIALSPVYTYVVLRAKSVFAAVLLHGVFNAASMTFVGLLSADSELLTQLVARTIGIAGIVACVLVWGLIYLRGTPTLDRNSLDWGSPGPAAPQTVSADETSTA